MDTYEQRPIPLLTTYYQDELQFIDNGEPLVQVQQTTHPKIVIQPIYYEQGIPNSLPNIYVRATVLQKLLQAADQLPEPYTLVLYDGYRPFAVQQALFEMIQRQIATRTPHLSASELHARTLTYVAFPSTEKTASAPHLTGGAIDLTLGDAVGRPLPMGTRFDEVSTKSATSYFELHEEDDVARRHRRLLFHTMLAVGFSNYEEEWWHYEFGTKAWAARTKNESTHYLPIDITKF